MDTCIAVNYCCFAGHRNLADEAPDPRLSCLIDGARSIRDCMGMESSRQQDNCHGINCFSLMA